MDDEEKKLQLEKVGQLARRTLDFVHGTAEELDVDLTRVAVTLMLGEDEGEDTAIASVYSGPEDDELVDEVMLLLKALETVAVERYGISRVTLAEAILRINIVGVEPARKTRAQREPPSDRRPTRRMGQPRRRA